MSGPLQTSTKISSGFALPRHSLPSFGSCPALMLHPPVGGRHRPVLRPPAVAGSRIPPQPGRPSPHLHCATGFHLRGPLARFLGPCFKTSWVEHQCRHGPLAPGRRGPSHHGGMVQSAPVESHAGSGGPYPPPRPTSPSLKGEGRDGSAGGRARRRSSPLAPGHSDYSCRGGGL